MTESKAYNNLIHKIDQFIRKYYWNSIIKGSLLVIGLNLFAFLSFNLLESQFYFSSTTRKVFFYSMILLFLSSTYLWVISPLLKYLKLGKTISHDEAANIIGQHFPEVDDKLLNVLHLSRQNTNVDNDLIYHSIEQKTDEIKWVPFPKAIDLQKNKKYLKYALPPVLILVALLFAAPSLITNSSYRLLHNNQEFVKEAPFQFILKNQSLELPQFEDITIQMETQGSIAPNEMYISLDGYNYRMEKNKLGEFYYTIKNVANPQDFSFQANGYQSNAFHLEVLKKPSLLEMNMVINPPAYTEIENKNLKNPGDITVPEGSVITWSFDTENMTNLLLQFKENNIDTLINTSNNFAHFERRMFKSGSYGLTFNNKELPNADSVQYFIETVADQYPGISMEKHLDSQSNNFIYIIGEVSDDYGINSLEFHYSISDQDQPVQFSNESMGNAWGKASTYKKIIDLNDYALQPGQSFHYYFEVMDNDGINGSKSSKTAIQTWTQKTQQEFEALEETTEESIKDNLSKLLKDQKALKIEATDLKNKLFQERNMEWEHKKELENLLKKQEEIQKSLSETQKMHEENKKNQEQFKKEQDPQNQQIDELLEQAKNPEMEKLMEKIKELMDKLKKEEAIEMLEQMDQQMNQSEMDMERLEDLYEKLEMESDIQDALDKLEEMAKEQDKLAQESMKEEKESDTEEQESSEEENTPSEKESDKNDGKENNADKNDGENEKKEEQTKEQEKLNEEFKKLSEELKDLFEKNKDIKNPLKMDDPKTPSEEIKKEQQDAKDNLQEGQQQEAGKKQKKAAEKMQEMKESMQSSMSGSQEEQQQEDLALLRQILDNLLRLSFNQESLIEDIDAASTTTPRYVELVREQFKLKNDFTLIQDSLLALANRNAQIQTAVTEKVNLIETHIGKSMTFLEERDKANAGNDQRRTMKNVNDLALLLSESLEDMQMSMSSSSSMCNSPNKPGKEGNMPMDKISEGQEKMSQEMQKMAKEKQGKGKGEKMSKEFAQIAAQQAALRKMLEDKQSGLMEQGKGSKELQELINLMDQMETDLVNKKLTNQMMKRQQEILTKLLEAEKAERQQEMDEKRKSESAKQLPKNLPPDLQEYLDKRREEISPYKKLSPALKPYYKRLVEEYYEQLKTD